jgi:hypothetical protein
VVPNNPGAVVTASCALSRWAPMITRWLAPDASVMENVDVAYLAATGSAACQGPHRALNLPGGAVERLVPQPLPSSLCRPLRRRAG